MFKNKHLKKVSNPFKSPKAASPKSDDLGSSLKSKLKISSSKESSEKFKSMSSSIKAQTSSAESKLFEASVLNAHGIKGKIVCIAHDYSQSLMAVANTSSSIHIFGQKHIEVVINLRTKGQIKTMNFIKGIYLVVTDSTDTLTVISLFSKKVLATLAVPGKITCIESDPSIDWLLVGLQSGSVIIYDVDRNQFSNLKLENFQKSQFFTKDRLSAVVSINWNPRDLGTILISYELVTVVYSFVEGEVKQHFIYKLPAYAPGGDFTTDVSTTRIPKVIQSVFHPNSLHILTVHEDNSLVFWDANSGKLIQARTLYETNINMIQNGLQTSKPSSDIPKIFKVSWICQRNPEYTSIMIATKPSNGSGNSQGVNILELGGTPLYSVTSYEKMSQYYASPKHEKLCPLVNKAPLQDIIPIPSSSPYFSGAHDPTFVLLLLENGEIETLLTASGLLSSKASLLPQCLSWMRPRATYSSAISVPNKLWLGMISSNAQSESVLKGGIAASKDSRVRNIRNAIISGHANGAVRIWDASSKDLDDNAVFEVNIGRLLNKNTNIAIQDVSFAPETLELAVASEDGTVILFKYEVNQFYDPQRKNIDRELDLNFSRFSIDDHDEPLIDIKDRASNNVRQGFMPGTVVQYSKCPISALKNSNIGFVGVAYQNGEYILVDRRGPAIIYKENILNISRGRSRFVTSFEFVIMQYGNDEYSSILMLCGTDGGELIVNKILPESSGRFQVEFIEIMRANDNDPISDIIAVTADTAFSCEANIAKMNYLTQGTCIAGKVIVVGSRDIRAIKLASGKTGSKSFKYPIASAGLSYVSYDNSKGERKIKSYVIAYLINGDLKILTAADLKEVKSIVSPIPVHGKYVTQSAILKNGDLFVRTDDYLSLVLTTVVGQESKIPPNSDILYNANLRIPYRPQVNSLQWARGTVYCTSEQLDEILGESNRVPSKYQESEIAAGTLSLRPDGDNATTNSETGYKKPVRRSQRQSSYGVLRGVSRTVETHWDALETQMNDYATAMGEGMNDVMEQTGKDIVKGSFGL